MNKVSVALVCWNGFENVKVLMESLETQTYRDFDVIIADNGSTDGSTEELRKLAGQKKIVLIENGKNLGFAGGINAALRAAKTPYVLALNDDMKLMPNYVEILVRELDEHQDVAVVQSKILSWDGTKIDMIGTQLTYGSMIARRGAGAPADAYGEHEYIEHVGGGGVIFRMEVLKKLGYFDESFFPGYYEDADLTWRLKEAGYKMYYCPEARVYHKHGGSMKRWGAGLSLSAHRNRYRFLLKHWTPLMWLRSFPMMIVITGYYIVRFDKNYFTATWEFLTGKIQRNELKW
ncbi:MAG: glycosyltransferase family 2 protein [Candidatus Aenigmatarchaeota archaeon]|nr:MAG: glycosyltransferase family 2 protein [Candidatus Aenigmarchaeota archaeon]